MQCIRGVVSQGEAGDDSATLTIIPLVEAPIRRLDPAASISVSMTRQPWQEPGSLQDYVDHIVGRAGRICFVAGDGSNTMTEFHTV